MTDIEGNKKLMEFLLSKGLHEGSFGYEYDDREEVMEIRAFVLSEAVKNVMEEALAEWEGFTWTVKVDPDRCPFVIIGKLSYCKDTLRRVKINKWYDHVCRGNDFGHPNVQQFQEMVAFLGCCGQPPRVAVANVALLLFGEDIDLTDIPSFED